MNIHEYQAKEILAQYGVAVPRGILPSSPIEAVKAAQELGGRVVVKAQIHAGGRGKAGGVKLAETPEEAGKIFNEFLGMLLVTKQNAPDGSWVRHVYVEEAASIKEELYLSIVIDRKIARVVIMASRAGGSGVEDKGGAANSLNRLVVDPLLGPTPHAVRALGHQLQLDSGCLKEFLDLVPRLYKAFVDLDCSLLEINPLAILEDGHLKVLDCKMSFDDNCYFRHPELFKYRDLFEIIPEEFEAAKYGLTYVRLDGNIGCMVNGAGLAMATLDAISNRGGMSANFLDLGGGASRNAVKKAFEIICEDKRIKAILINVLGGIVRCDEVAAGIQMAIEAHPEGLVRAGITLPIIARLSGNHAEEGREALSKTPLAPFFTVQFASNMDEAARFAVAASKLEPKPLPKASDAAR